MKTVFAFMLRTHRSSDFCLFCSQRYPKCLGEYLIYCIVGVQYIFVE